MWSPDFCKHLYSGNRSEGSMTLGVIFEKGIYFYLSVSAHMRQASRAEHTGGVHAVIINGQPWASFITCLWVCNNSRAGPSPLPASQFETCLSFKSGRGFWNHITCLVVCVSASTLDKSNKNKWTDTVKRVNYILDSGQYTILLLWWSVWCTRNVKWFRCLIYYNHL